LPKPTKVPERNDDENKFVFHKVEIGDTLWAIAKKYAGITVENIKLLNGIKDNESLKAGMILKIPKKG
jgi:membrane-bound lytic murein transglycosylase D